MGKLSFDDLLEFVKQESMGKLMILGLCMGEPGGVSILKRSCLDRLQIDFLKKSSNVKIVIQNG
jgi:hypothetical protein